MKVTKSQIRQIIQEEVQKVLKENWWWGTDDNTPPENNWEGLSNVPKEHREEAEEALQTLNLPEWATPEDVAFELTPDGITAEV